MDDHTRDIIERVVREQLVSDTVRILNVTVTEDPDAMPERSCNVLVTYDAPHGVLDPDMTVGLVRHTRQTLANRAEDLFPIFSFVSRSDAKSMIASLQLIA